MLGRLRIQVGNQNGEAEERRHDMLVFLSTRTSTNSRTTTTTTPLLCRPATVDRNAGSCGYLPTGNMQTAQVTSLTDQEKGNTCLFPHTQNHPTNYTPVICAADLLHRNAASSPMSSGVANVFEGCLDDSSRSVASWLEICNGAAS